MGRRLSLILLLGAVAFSGCGSGSETTSTGEEATSTGKETTADTTAPAKPAKKERLSPPSGPIAPSKTLVTIEGAPQGTGKITGAEFDQGVTQAVASRSLKATPKPGGEEYEGIRNEVLANLIIYVWLEGEAKEMGIEPTDEEVADALRKSGEEDSLREHEYTQATMMARAKNTLLVEEIEHALARQSPKNPEKAYREFDAQFEKQWRAGTHCVRGFVVQQCGNSRE